MRSLSPASHTHSIITASGECTPEYNPIYPYVCDLCAYGRSSDVPSTGKRSIGWFSHGRPRFLIVYGIAPQEEGIAQPPPQRPDCTGLIAHRLRGSCRKTAETCLFKACADGMRAENGTSRVSGTEYFCFFNLFPFTLNTRTKTHTVPNPVWPSSAYFSRHPHPSPCSFLRFEFGLSVESVVFPRNPSRFSQNGRSHTIDTLQY